MFICKVLLRLLIVIVSLILLISCDSGGGHTFGDDEVQGRLAQLRETPLPPPDTLSATPSKLPPFVAFESGQVRPLALSENKAFLYAVNTPDNSLEVFRIGDNVLTPIQSIPVGMEPVAVAVNGSEVWVVNHLSDSVSIIDTALNPARVVKTLLVGDEPRDIVFAGSNRSRAFITTAHRGQNSPVDPQYTTAGIGRADVWVFDSENLGVSLGGEAVNIVTVFGDTPRALATSNDGSKVYVAVFNSGNKTTAVHQIPTTDKALPVDNTEGFEAPLTAYIVQHRDGHWRDENGRTFDDQAALNLPDYDVFTIDANAALPKEIDRISGVGTSLFNMAVHPTNNQIFVSNSEARNQVRFEGFGSRSTTVRGHFVDERISIIDNGQVKVRDLNKHLNRNQLHASQSDKDASLSMPLEMVFSQNGQRLFVAAMGSNKIAVLNSAELERDQFNPKSQIHIELTGGGPTGIILDESRGQAFALTRYDNGISVIDLDGLSESSHLTMFNPEPESIVDGRPFLYDATLTSSNGASSCAGCHLFADTDHLSWDLGNPEEVVADDPHPVVPFSNPTKGPFQRRQKEFHPMKGPKGTQSLRGMPNHGPLHWRGDRTGINRVNGESQEEAAFKEFNVAFRGLIGREDELSEQQMQAFTDFAMQLSYPPNPNKPLDNQLTPDMAEGHRVYSQLATSGNFQTRDGENLGCNSCHILDPKNGRFGSAANMVAVLGNNNQDFKVPHFRNLYQKVGLFRGGSSTPQIRGFGFSQNGVTAGLMELLDGGEFTFETNRQSSQLAEFLFAYDSLMAPIVGQQVTLSQASGADALARVDLMVERAQVSGEVPECDLVVRGVWQGEQRGAVRLQDDSFQSDKSDEAYSLQQLKALAEESENHLTFMCVPPNSGTRIGIDRDLNGVFNGDDN